MNQKIFFIFLSLLSVSNLALAQFFPSKVYRLDDGIPSYSVYDIAQTPDGLMWFLSPQGVFSYNSVSWNLTPDTLDIPHTANAHLKTTEDGVLWVVGVNNSGFSLFKYRDDKWKKVDLPKESAFDRIKHSFSFDIKKSLDSYEIAVAIQDTIYQVNLENGVLEKNRIHKNHVKINDIQYHDESVLIATSSGLFTRGSDIVYSHPVNNLTSDKTISTFTFTNNRLYLLGNDWLGHYTANDGLTTLASNLSFSRFSTINMHSMVVDSEGRVFFCSKSTPEYYDPETGKAIQIVIKGIDFDYLANKLFLDHENNLWIGDHRGLFKLDISGFKNFNKESGMLENEVSAIHNDKDKLLVANPSGINFMSGNSIERQFLLKDHINFRVLDIEKFDEKYYTANSHGGINIIKNGQILPFQGSKDVFSRVNSVEKFRNELFTGTPSGIFTSVGEKIDIGFNPRYLRNMKALNEDSLMIMTTEDGILLKTTDEVTQFKSSDIDLNNVYSFVKYQNKLLAGTAGGLAIIQGDSLTKYSLSEEFKNGAIYAFLNQNDKRLWIGTNIGLFLIENGKTYSFDIKHGLLGNDVARNALVMDENEIIWIGTESGLSSYDTKYLKRRKITPALQFLSIVSDGIDIKAEPNIELHHDNNDLKFEFVGLTFINEELVEYNYQLKGYNDEWVTGYKSNSVLYENLPPGDYTFQIKSRIEGYQWGKLHSYPFKIKIPFYESFWFKASVILMAMAFIYLIFRLRYNYLIRSRHKLQKAVAARTRDLESKNKAIEKQNEELIEKGERIIAINEELENTIDNLRSTQQQLIQSEKMVTLGIMSSGVSHEFNNPLNYIMNGVIILEKNLKEESGELTSYQKELFTIIFAGIDKVTSIVKSLNELSTESKISEKLNLPGIINNCLVVMKGKTGNKIELTREIESEDLFVRGNKGKLHQVFINILTNAVYAIENIGTIHVNVETRGNHVLTKIIDDGEGISEEDLKRVIDPFFTTKEPGQGTGLGLSISLSILREHKGNLEIDSKVGKGTIVTIILPLFD